MWQKIVKLLGYVSAVLKALVTPLPTEDELRANFPHASTCAADRSFDEEKLVDNSVMWLEPLEYYSNLEEIEEERFMSSFSPWVGGIVYTVSLLKCRHCGCKVQFRR